MSSHGIKNRVAIIGMGCTPFVEAWGKGLDDLVIEAASRHMGDACLPLRGQHTSAFALGERFVFPV